MLAKRKCVAVCEEDVGLGARHGRNGALEAGQPLLELACPRDVVGVAVRVERQLQRQARRLNGRNVTVDVLQHRVHQQRLAGGGAAEEVGVGGRAELVE